MITINLKSQKEYHDILTILTVLVRPTIVFLSDWSIVSNSTSESAVDYKTKKKTETSWNCGYQYTCTLPRYSFNKSYDHTKYSNLHNQQYIVLNINTNVFMQNYTNN